jgi:hypothetical protein
MLLNFSVGMSRMFMLFSWIDSYTESNGKALGKGVRHHLLIHIPSAWDAAAETAGSSKCEIVE